MLRASYGDTLAVEMEGRGFLEGCERGRTPGLLVRGISDILKQANPRAEEER